MMKKRLLILSIFPAPYRVAVFRELAAHYEVDLFFEVVQNQDRNAKWFVESDDIKVLNTRENIRAYRQCLRQIKSYDLVLAYDYFSKRANVLMLRCMAAGVPYAINCDGAFIQDQLLKTAVKKLFVSHAALCFASGKSAGAYFRHYGARPEQIRYHHFTSLCAQDYPERLPDQAEKRRLRAQLGIEDRKTVLTIGQFIHRKGFDILLKAWSEVEEDANLLIVGGGGLRQEYLDLIRRYRLKHVHILDFMEREALNRLYRQADLFVLPTREDVWGLVINEAMANGLPVVTTNRCIAGVELIQNGKNGYVVPAENPRMLALAIHKILSSSKRQKAMGENSFQTVRGKTVQDIGRGHIRDIDDFLTRREKRPADRQEEEALVSAAEAGGPPEQVDRKENKKRNGQPERDIAAGPENRETGSAAAAQNEPDTTAEERTVYVVTSVHDRRQITERFVACLNRQTYKNICLVLVDDGCTDGTPQMVRQALPHSVILRGNGNLWWGGGLHKAYLWIRSHVEDPLSPVLITNDDTVYADDYIERGVRLLETYPGTMVGGSGYGLQSGQQLDGIFYHSFRDGTGRLLPPGRRGNCASTRSLFLTVGDWKKTGGMHPVLLPHYASDFEFTIRAYRKGIQIRSFEQLTYTFDEGTTGENQYEKLTLKKMFSKRSACNPVYRISFILLSTPPRYLPGHLAHQVKRYAGKLGILKRIMGNGK